MAKRPDSDFRKNPDKLDTLKKIRKLYSKLYPGTDLHHPIPVSRIPSPHDSAEALDNRMIVFPYDVRAHPAFHALTWNLRIDQVWNDLGQIHRSIFETKDDKMRQWWIEACDLESGDFFKRSDFYDRKSRKIKELLETKHLRNVWFRSFGSEDLSTAENLMKIMMLFMVFGPKMVDKKKLFNNGNMKDFFENNQANSYQLWAFETLFGDGGSIQGIKSKIAHILNKNKFYSL